MVPGCDMYNDDGLTEYREDGTYSYNPVTDRWIKVSDYTPTRGSSFGSSVPSPWSYEGIKQDLDFSISYGYGVKNENDKNLYNRIQRSNMSSSERQMLLSLLNRAVAMYQAREEKNKRENSERKVQDKQDAIKKYREVWRSKSALWRMFHKKYNPKNIDFDKRETFDIEMSADYLRKR